MTRNSFATFMTLRLAHIWFLCLWTRKESIRPFRSLPCWRCCTFRAKILNVFQAPCNFFVMFIPIWRNVFKPKTISYLVIVKEVPSANISLYQVRNRGIQSNQLFPFFLRQNKIASVCRLIPLREFRDLTNWRAATYHCHVWSVHQVRRYISGGCHCFSVKNLACTGICIQM